MTLISERPADAPFINQTPALQAYPDVSVSPTTFEDVALLGRYRTLIEASVGVNDLMDPSKISALQEDVGKWFIEQDLASLEANDRVTALSQYLGEKDFSSVNYLDLAATETILELSQRLGDKLPEYLKLIDAPTDISKIVPILGYLPEALQSQAAKGLPGSILENTNHTEVAVNGNWIGRFWSGIVSRAREVVRWRTNTDILGKSAVGMSVEQKLVTDLSVEQLFNENDGVLTFRPADDLGPTLSQINTGYHDARVTLVNRMGWLGEITEDWDAYDRTNETIACVKTKPSENGGITFVAGLRATHTPTVEESMSFGMLSGSAAMQQEILTKTATDPDIAEAIAKGKLWDITRQVVQLDGSVTMQEFEEGTAEAFGAAVAATCPEDDPATVWVFAATQSLKCLLARSGVDMSILTKGAASPDDATNGITTYFIAVKPGPVLTTLASAQKVRHAAFYEGLSKGMQSVHRLD